MWSSRCRADSGTCRWCSPEGSALFGQPIWLLLADIVAKSILFTWVFLRTRGSVLIAALLHGTTNLFLVSPTVVAAGDLLWLGLALAAKWLLVLVIVIVCGPGPDAQAVRAVGSRFATDCRRAADRTGLTPLWRTGRGRSNEGWSTANSGLPAR